MEKRLERIYDTLCKTLTDYEDGEINNLEFYSAIVSVVNEICEDV